MIKTIRERIHEWLFFAQSDLEGAEISFKEEIYHLVCFHSHQCVEKTLKAMMVDPETSPPKTHDLGDLLQEVSKKNSLFLEFLDDIQWLNKFYIPTRYPDAFPGSLPEGLPTKEDAQKAVKIAGKIFEKGKEILERKQ